MSAATSTTKSAAAQKTGWRGSQKARFRLTLVVKYIVAAIVLTFSLFPDRKSVV